ncbi:hypothetical protein [Lactobacillus taiwanensis]|mgnify:CR=1 FL=1|uniref:hypothetical protein n=1 Tax=Lactobacillus taiwanensis TaxID=508451 RepID=UPI00242FB0F5|nr:hypothetical protein [Lactobacillus taiwanensis]
MTSENKEFRVAKIINDKSLIVTAGDKDGIKIGDQMEIVDKSSDIEVKDPETGEILGTLDATKGTVEVTKVFPHMSIVEPPKRTVPGLTAAATLNHGFSIQESLNRMMTEHVVQDSLNVDPEQITGSLPQSSKPIRVGDIVIKN